MAVSIRLSRRGTKKAPHYWVVAVDSKAKREGQYLDHLGNYVPQAKADADRFKIDRDRLAFWLARGAQTSETVGQLVKTFAQ